MFYVYESQLALCMCLSLLRLLAHYVSHTARIMCFGTIVWCSTGWSIACIERWRNIFVYSCVHVVYVYVSLCSLAWRYVLHGNWTTKRHKYSEPSGTLNTTSRHTVKCNFFNIIIVINIITHPLQLKLDSLSLALSYSRSLTHFLTPFFISSLSLFFCRSDFEAFLLLLFVGMLKMLMWKGTNRKKIVQYSFSLDRLS